jgi:predicted  nucleic acid-binding Zn-ribbon protein
VNGAIEKVDEKYVSEHGETENEQYPILRLGAGGRVLKESRLLLETQIEVASHDLMLEKERLEKEFDEIQKKVVELKKVITECNWIENTQIDTIKTISNSISEVSLSIDTKKKQLALIQQEVQTQLATHPEYQEALDLKNAIKKAEKEIALLDDRINSISSEINALTEKTQV